MSPDDDAGEDTVTAKTPKLDPNAPIGTPHPPNHAERYQPLGVLGAGGMGEIKLCRDRVMGRDVALKVLLESKQGDADWAGRFAREGRLQGRLEHPSIVPVYDVGVTADGREYFTMKRIRGRTLSEIIDGLAKGNAEVAAAFSRRKLLTAFVNVCLAVELAHSRGVVHRDLKPGNVMLGDFGEVYVLDWGIAKVGDTDAPAAATFDSTVEAYDGPALTGAGVVLGTPGYMAPEQALGDVESIDARTDVYALGAILHELITLTPLNPPPKPKDPNATTVRAGLVRAPAVSTGEQMPPELARVCAQATALNPAERLASARELANAIERFLDGDRDLERRRALADQHAAVAETLAAKALEPGGTLAARQRTLAEIGQALGLDPMHQQARRMLVRVMASAPSELPVEAQSALQTSIVETQVLGAKIGVRSYALWLLGMGPVAVWMGIKDPVLFGVVIAAHLAALGSTLWATRWRTIGGWPVTLASLFAMFASFTLNFAYGPLLLVPTVIAATSATILFHPHKYFRTATIVISSLSIAGPWLASALGLAPPSYRFENGGMSVVPHMLHFTEMPTLLGLLLASLATVLALFSAVTTIRDAYTDAERRLQLQAWHLRQLVADEPMAHP